MDGILKWLQTQDRFCSKYVVVPNKNFQFELKRFLAANSSLALLFNCHILTPRGFIKLISLDMLLPPLYSHSDLKYGFQHCLSLGRFDGLKYFEVDQLREGLGYADCFASTIHELDLAGLSPDDLLSSLSSFAKQDKDRLKDVAAVWKAVFREIEEGVQTISYKNALSIITESPRSNTYWLGYDSDPWVFRDASAKCETKEGFKDEAGLSELDWSFESWASVEEEDAATLYWIEENLNQGRKLQELAILTTSKRPALMQRIQQRFGKSSLYAPEAVGSWELRCFNQKVAQILEAVAGNLAAELMPRVLSILKYGAKKEQADQDIESPLRFRYFPKSESDWVNIINQTGCVGGNRANASGVSEWTERLQAYWPECSPYSDAIEKLVGFVLLINSGQSMDDLGPVLLGFLSSYVHFSQAEQVHLKVFKSYIEKESQKSWMQSLRGDEVLAFLEDALNNQKIGQDKLGEGRIYVGAIEEAFGSKYSAIRVVGLQEGTVPQSLRQDPILSDELREGISNQVSLRLQDSKIKTKKLFHIFSNTTSGISLSTYQQDLASKEKSFSGLFYNVLSHIEPTSSSLEEAFEDRVRVRVDQVLCALNEQKSYQQLEFLSRAKLKAGNDGLSVPSQYQSLADALENRARVNTSLEYEENCGYFQKTSNNEELKPLSPSSVGTFLSCPRKYFLSRKLKFEDAEEVLVVGSLDAMTRGSMIHQAIEDLSNTYKVKELSGFNANQMSEAAEKLVDGVFLKFPVSNFLGGEVAIENEKQAYRDIVLRVLQQDVGNNLAEIIAEKKLEFTLQGLRFKGKVDRIEKTNEGKFRIVDFKSGRGSNKDREENPFLPEYDLQLALYCIGLVENGEAKETDFESLEFRYPESDQIDERAFSEGDLVELIGKSKKWIELIKLCHQMNFFPPVASDSGCRFCPFVDTCDVHNVDYARKQMPTPKLKELFDEIFVKEEGQ